jgi:abequosyltransferase
MKSNTTINNLPLLTIAIPTYNRSAALDRCLKCITDQVDNSDWRIEILVSDNCSPDNTGEVVSKYIEHGCRVRYIRNEENMGIDFNVAQCYKEAAGKFAVAFGDDDILLSGGIDLIINTIQENPDCGVIHLNAYAANNLEGSVIPFSKPVDFINQVHYDITFITANIINRELIDWDNLLACRNTFLNHVNLLYEAVFQAPVNIIIRQQLVVGAGIENSEGYNFYEVFGKNFNQIIKAVEDKQQISGLSKHINAQLLIHFLPAVVIIQKRRSLHFDPIKVHRLLAPVFKDSFYYWGFCLPIIMMPHKGIDHQSYLRMKKVLYKMLNVKRVINNFTRT